MPITPSRRLRRVAIALVLAVMALAACSSGDDSSASAVGDLAAAESWLGTPVPATATDFRFEEETSGLDDFALMRFDLPADDLDAFMQAVGLDDALRDGRNTVRRSSGPDWFMTDQLVDFAGADGWVNGHGLQITVDLADAETVTVYAMGVEV